jgi:hypothetical protein
VRVILPPGAWRCSAAGPASSASLDALIWEQARDSCAVGVPLTQARQPNAVAAGALSKQIDAAAGQSVDPLP